MPGKTKNVVGMKMRGGGKVNKMRGGGKVMMAKGGKMVTKKGKKKSVVKKRGRPEWPHLEQQLLI